MAFLDLTSFRLLTGTDQVGSPGQKPPGRVGSPVKNPDPVQFLNVVCELTAQAAGRTPVLALVSSVKLLLYFL